MNEILMISSIEDKIIEFDIICNNCNERALNNIRGGQIPFIPTSIYCSNCKNIIKIENNMFRIYTCEEYEKKQGRLK